MTASEGKTLGLILLVLIILIVAWPLKLLLFAPLAALSGVFHTWPWSFERIHIGPLHFLGLAGYSFIALALLLLWIAVVVWVYRDAERRGMSGVLWALVVFFAHLAGLVIYVLVRSGHPLLAGESVSQPPVCPKCHKSVGKNHAFCPYCGDRIQAVCPKCAKPVEKSWQACPHCGEKL